MPNVPPRPAPLPAWRILEAAPDTLTNLERLRQPVLRCLDNVDLIYPDDATPRLRGKVKISEIMRIARQQEGTSGFHFSEGMFRDFLIAGDSGRGFEPEAITLFQRDLMYVMKEKLGPGPELKAFSRHLEALADYLRENHQSNSLRAGGRRL